MKYSKNQLTKMKKEQLIKLVLELQERSIDSHAEMLANKRREKKKERLQSYYKILEENRDKINFYTHNEEICEWLDISLKTFYNLKLKDYLIKNGFYKF